MDRQLMDEIKGLNDYETRTERLTRKLRETPFLGVGILGMIGACSIGAFRFNRRAVDVSASFYLTQLRIAAQGCVVGSLAVGMVYNACRQGHCAPAEAQTRSEE